MKKIKTTIIKKAKIETKKGQGNIKYNSEFHSKLAYEFTAEGFTDEEVSKKIGISRSTLKVWRKKYKTFDIAIAEGKNLIDDKVEKSLFQRAMGFDYEEIEIILDEKGGRSNKRVKKIQKRALPDVTAQIFWLKNRRPLQWRDRKEIDITNFQEKAKKIHTLADNFRKTVKGGIK